MISNMSLMNALNTIVLAAEDTAQNQIQGDAGFKIPTLTDFLTFIIRFFFVLAGLAALIFLLLGAFSWITSGGNKENVEKAREKIVAAIVGIILVILVVSIMIAFEQFVFNKHVCFGISCPLTIPALIK